MAIDDEYAAIGIDVRAWRRAIDEELEDELDEGSTAEPGWPGAPAAGENRVELKVGYAVLRLRLYWGWSQLTLESRSGVDQTTISRLERGRQRGLSIRRLFKILHALRVGEVVFLPRPPKVEPTSLELMLHGDPWQRATIEAGRRVNRRRSA
jgi:transcriptional regulator with XRE-family HTH domain